MEIPLPLHLFIHLALAVLAGYLVGRHFKKVWLGIIAGMLGGFFIDLDHVAEYFFTFGFHFNLYNFLQGQQFLQSDKIILIFHTWEYVPVLLLIAWLLRRRQSLSVFLLALTLGGAVHLATDSVINHFPFCNYSLIHRWSVGFSTQQLLGPERYQEGMDRDGLLNTG